MGSVFLTLLYLRMMEHGMVDEGFSRLLLFIALGTAVVQKVLQRLDCPWIKVLPLGFDFQALSPSLIHAAKDKQKH